MRIEETGPQTALHLTTRVGPGHRIEITAPQLVEGATVEVFLIMAAPAETQGPRRSMMDFLETLPPGPRSAPTWEEFERQFDEERNSWDR
jgi:hypothetical protein